MILDQYLRLLDWKGRHIFRLGVLQFWNASNVLLELGCTSSGIFGSVLAMRPAFPNPGRTSPWLAASLDRRPGQLPEQGAQRNINGLKKGVNYIWVALYAIDLEADPNWPRGLYGHGPTA